MSSSPSYAGGVATERPVFRVGVDVVLLNFTVRDKNSEHVAGLTPRQIRILENGTPQRIDSFAEGRSFFQADGKVESAGTNVFVLFDTSDHMYESFVHAQDAIADFIRSLGEGDAVAVYSFSRNLSRPAELTRDREKAVAGLRDACAGAGTALYNNLLLTIRDAAKAPGRKVIVVFSNGSDNASVLSPDDVRRVA